jgi:E3 ubiquitin-protein ligase makorin
MVMSGVIKRCPYCRSPSRFITPSTHYFPQDHPRKQEMIESYKNSMARVPCKLVQSPCAPPAGLIAIM